MNFEKYKWANKKPKKTIENPLKLMNRLKSEAFSGDQKWGSRNVMINTEPDLRQQLAMGEVAREEYWRSVMENTRNSYSSAESFLYGESTRLRDYRVFADTISSGNLSSEPMPNLGSLSEEKEELPNEYLFNVEVLERNSAYGNTREYRYYCNGECIAKINETPYKDCCGICLLHSISISFNFTQEEFNNFLNSIISDLRNNDKFGKIMIYTNVTNRSQKRLFSRFPEIIIMNEFTNPRTGNIICGFEIDL